LLALLHLTVRDRRGCTGRAPCRESMSSDSSEGKGRLGWIGHSTKWTWRGSQGRSGTAACPALAVSWQFTSPFPACPKSVARQRDNGRVLFCSTIATSYGSVLSSQPLAIQENNHGRELLAEPSTKAKTTPLPKTLDQQFNCDTAPGILRVGRDGEMTEELGNVEMGVPTI